MYFVSRLKSSEKKALQEFKDKLAASHGSDSMWGNPPLNGDEKLKKFLRWGVQILERGIKLLHFKPGVFNSTIQVTNFKDVPKKELRVASNQIISLFQGNYPKIVARKVKLLHSYCICLVITLIRRFISLVLLYVVFFFSLRFSSKEMLQKPFTSESLTPYVFLTQFPAMIPIFNQNFDVETIMGFLFFSK